MSAVRSLTWRELERGELRGWPAATAGWGWSAGDRLASLMPNRIDLVVHYLACFKAGLVATPLNYRYTFREIDHALEVSGAGALLAHVERAEDVAASALAGELRCGLIAYRDGRSDGAADGDWAHRLRGAARGRAAGRRPAPDPTIRRRSSSPRAAPGRPRA